jgi:hypothetical protein
LKVGRQRVRLPAGTVEREHQLDTEVLAVGMLRHQRLELRDQLDISTDR